jgi:hypothetical protein
MRHEIISNEIILANAIIELASAIQDLCAHSVFISKDNEPLGHNREVSPQDKCIERVVTLSAKAYELAHGVSLQGSSNA